jgi:hypothetical protein
MTDLTRRPTDETLIAALRELGPDIDWPTIATTPDLATRVRVGLTDQARRPVRPHWHVARRWRIARRGLVLAVVLVLALAAVASAIALGLPGLRLVLGDLPVSLTPASSVPATAAPSGSAGAAAAPTAGPPGSAMGLGREVDLAEAEAAAGRTIHLPTDPSLGPPDVVYVEPAKRDAVALVWADGADLPTTTEPGVGLVIVAFDGTTGPEWYTKVIDGGTTLESVVVAGNAGFWISGDAHFFYVIDENDQVIEDSRRWVGDTLVWSDGPVTYRLESGLGRDAAIRIAESLE